ncbi:MAG: hypothetical protein HLUCCX10_13870 [Algoriphagus marincola HL-49]|uniref:Uncharacterized protein n=1 Tax=Algoriphagus marincola HL-49 TaxID=1305737 RepID=A0A0N8KF51_9BACT|nr:MAG: hypothetical protein HLUCCX10_13870 [Algoriphagus marincola HL-49]
MSHYLASHFNGWKERGNVKVCKMPKAWTIFSKISNKNLRIRIERSARDSNLWQTFLYDDLKMDNNV